MRENRFLKKHLPSAKKKKIAFPPSFWCVCARGKRNPAGDASEIEKGNGDVRQRGDYNTYSSNIRVLIRTRVSSLSLRVLPGTRYIQAQNRLHNQRYGGLFRAEKLLVSRDYLITGVASSRVTPSSCDGGEAQFPPRTWIHCEAPPCVKSAVHAGSLTRVIKSYLLALGTTQISSYITKH